MPAALFAIAFTLIGQGYDQPGDKPELVRVIGQELATPWLVSSGLIDSGFKGNDAYVDGHFSITAPVFSDIGKGGTLAGTLVFVEPYISWGEQGEVATSLGLGARHFWNDQPRAALNPSDRPIGWLDEGVMLGVNGFVDMLSTRSHQQFWQLGAGLELATHYIELRANYYHPLSERKDVEDRLLRYEGREERLTSGDEPFATGHTIQQDVTFTTYDLYTETIFRRYEEGLKGWDAEAAVLVPWLEHWTELWLIGGYANFDNKPFGPQLHGTGPVRGWKAGIEWRPLPQLVLSATWFEDKRLAGGDWVAGISFQIPLDPDPANPEKTFWRKLKDSMKPGSRHLVERAAVPVHRQNAAVKLGISSEEPEIKRIAKVVRSRKARLVVTDNVIFVNNSGVARHGIAASGAVENGTAEHPFDTIQEGTDLASTAANQHPRTPTVFVAGGGAAYEETISINAVSIHYASGGYGVQAYAGKFFGLDPRARISAGGGGPFGTSAVVEVNKDIYDNGGSSNSFWIDGFRLDGSVLAFNVHDVRVRGNHISQAGDFAVTIEAGARGSYFVDVSGNLLESELGVHAQFGDLSDASLAPLISARVIIADNAFHMIDSPFIGSGTAISLTGVGTNVFMDASLSNNVIFGEGVGLSVPFTLNAFGGDEPSALLLHSEGSNTLIGFPSSEPPIAVFSTLGIFGELRINERSYRFP